MQAIILSIGDELVLGQTLDTNSQWLSAHLAGLGIGTLYHQTVGDDLEAIARSVSQAAERAELVIATGGLGPTADDLSRQALAQVMNAPLVYDPASLEAIRRRMERIGRKMAESNRLQATHPQGSTMLPNTCGTAPGLKAAVGRAVIYILPGPPVEMTRMYELAVEPDLADLPDRPVILTCKINTFGKGESNVGELLADLMDRRRNPLVGTTVSQSIVSVRVRSEFADALRARRELDATVEEVKRRLGSIVFGQESQPIHAALFEVLRAQGRSLATAESCTGGLIGAMITEMPGASTVYRGGWVPYSNALKQAELGVPAETLERFGAVSEQVAEAMARGALERSGADCAIAVTGIAGPEGGTREKPVGTVWVAIAVGEPGVSASAGPVAEASGGGGSGASGVSGGGGSGGGPRVLAQRFNFMGDRDLIRDRAAKSALQMLRLYLLGEPVEDMLWAIQPEVRG